MSRLSSAGPNFQLLTQARARSIVDQVSQFETFLADKPEGAEWDSSNSLFAFWIGINDVVGGIPRVFEPLLLTRLDVARATRSLGYAFWIFGGATSVNTEILRRM